MIGTTDEQCRTIARNREAKIQRMLVVPAKLGLAAVALRKGSENAAQRGNGIEPPSSFASESSIPVRSASLQGVREKRQPAKMPVGPQYNTDDAAVA